MDFLLALIIVGVPIVLAIAVINWVIQCFDTGLKKERSGYGFIAPSPGTPVPQTTYENPNIRIEVQDSSGWSFIDGCGPTPSEILQAMRRAKGNFPDKRVRAVSSSGALVDILTD